MKPFRMIFLFMLAAMLATSTKSYTNEVLVHVDSENFSMDIQPEDSFLNILESIGSYFEASETENPDPDVDTVLAEANSRLYTMDVFVTGSKISRVIAKQPKNVARNYYAPIAQSEKNDIAFILRTLSNNSWIKILKNKSALKKAGDRIDHLHPFNFLYTIFGDNELLVCARSIQGKAFVWKEFLNGTTTSLGEEYLLDNLKYEYVQDFAAKLKVDPVLLNTALTNRQWEYFVDLLILHVPRQEGGDRYNQ